MVLVIYLQDLKTQRIIHISSIQQAGWDSSAE